MKPVNLFLIFFVTLFSYTPIQAQSQSSPGQSRWQETNDTRVNPIQKTPSPPSPEEETNNNPSPSPSPQETKTDQASTFVPPPPPPGNPGAPSQRSHAGSRGCNVEGEGKLTALVPAYSQQQAERRFVLGTTTAKYPKFWFYVPYQASLTGELVLQNEQDNTLYATEMTLPSQPGVISVSVPSTAAPLKQGQQYHWQFKVYCGSQYLAHVEGGIQRKSNPASSTQLQGMTLSEQVTFYGAKGIWYEALSAASQLHRSNPTNQIWAALLQDVGLGELAEEPILENYQENQLGGYR